MICGAYLAASVFHSSWGLPNGNRTWAADSVAPMTPLAVAYRTFAESGFDSGYFYFKYPVGHQLVLAAATAPVMLVAYLRGDLSGIENDYPFGLVSADDYLAAMAHIARFLSALFATGVIALVAALTSRWHGRLAGALAALVAAGCYPLLFYAHTSNVEAAFLFWSWLALFGAVVGVEDQKPRALWVMGFAAAMAVSTKEQILGFVVLLPLVLVIHHAWTAHGATGWRRLLPRGAVTGGIIAVVTWAGVNAAFFNPSGFLNRIRFLTHTLPADVRARYAAYEFPVDFSSTWSGGDELAHLGKVLSAVLASIGWPAAVTAVCGLAWIVAKRRRDALWLLAAALGYYLVSLRVLKQVELRYVLPWSILAAVPAGVFLARLVKSGRIARAVAAGVIGFGLVYSGEVLRLLANDARYAAERWMQPHIDEGRRIEVLQSWTYLPRWEAVRAVSRPPVDAMSIDAVRSRSPDFIVISSKGKEGITMYPNPDWRDGRGMMLTREENLAMLEALESGNLGYERVERFAPTIWIPRELITSLAPTIDVYRRLSSEAPPGLMTTGSD